MDQNGGGRVDFLELGDEGGAMPLPHVPEPLASIGTLDTLPTAEQLARENLTTTEVAERPDTIEFSRMQQLHEFSTPEQWYGGMPTLHEFRQYLDAQAEHKRDYPVPLRGMQVHNDDGSVTLSWRTGDEEEEPAHWPSTVRALEAFGQRVDTPAGVTKWMLNKGHSDLCAEALNRQAGRTGLEDPDKSLLIRARANNGSRYVRGVLSDQYVPLDCDLVFGILDDLFSETGPESGIQETRLAALRYDGDRVHAVLAYPDAYFIEPGDSGYMPITVVRNNEIGGGSVSLESGVARSVCTNMSVFGFKQAVEGIRQRHVGKIDGPRLRADIATALEESFKVTAEIGDRLREAKQIPVPNVGAMIVHLARSLRMPKTTGGRWMAAYRDEAMTSEVSRGTAFGVTQSLSRLARAYSGDRRADLEGQAGDLLGGDVTANWARHVDRAEDIDREAVLAYVGGQATA